jgi:hypothetical protein
MNKRDKHYNLKIYRIIRKNGGWMNWSMIEIEKYPCKDSIEACKKERELYESLNCQMNTNFPQRDYQEWRIANKENVARNVKNYAEMNNETIAEYKKNYANNNKEKIDIYKKEWYFCNKQEISVNNKSNYLVNKTDIDAKNKEYREMNQDEYLAQKKKYREIHKEQIKEKRSELFICECGREINHAHKSRHLKTKVHNDLMLLKNVTSV